MFSSHFFIRITQIALNCSEFYVYERRRGTSTRTIKSIVINENLLYVNLETKIRILLDLYFNERDKEKIKDRRSGRAGRRRRKKHLSIR